MHMCWLDVGRTILILVAFSILKLLHSLTRFSYLYLSFSLTSITYIFHELYWKRRFLPPGPIPWLVLGNMPLLAANPCIYQGFQDMRQKYGPIFTFWMGPISLVMVCEPTIMKDYFVKKAAVFSGRWRNFVTDSLLEGPNGIVQIDGEKWEEQRKFAMHILRDFGFGKTIMESKIMIEVESFVQSLDEDMAMNPSAVLDLSRPLSLCVGNIINAVLFGRRFEKNDEQFYKLQTLLDRQSRLVVQPLIGAYIAAPWTRHIPGFRAPWIQLIQCRDGLLDYLRTEVQRHKLAFVSTIAPRDFTFAYLHEMDNRRAFGREHQLTIVLLDLWFAGMETTIATLKWGFLFMMLNQKVQSNVHEELDENWPSDGRCPTMADRGKFPYTMATINEIQRLANILPVNLLRTVSETTRMGEFVHRKNSLVIPQISVTLFDPAIFPQPMHFNPERFLEDDLKSLKKCDHLLPFSMGKRQCLGESLARAELFLIFANILKRFHFSVPNFRNPPSLIRKPGLTVSPQKYMTLVERRLL